MLPRFPERREVSNVSNKTYNDGLFVGKRQVSNIGHGTFNGGTFIGKRGNHIFQFQFL